MIYIVGFVSLLRLFWYVTSPIWKNIILRYQIEVQNWAIRPNFWVYKEYYYFSTPPFSFWLLIRVIWSTIPMTWLILNFRDFLGKGGRNLGPDKTLGGRFFKKKFFFLKDLSICSKGTNFGDISIISTPYFSKPTNQGLPLSNQPLCPLYY